MIKIVTFILLSLFFIACSKTMPSAEHTSAKSFAQEDLYILFALRAEQIKDNNAAADLFTELYEKSHNKEYLYRSLENDLAAKKNTHVINRVDAYSTSENSYDANLVRLKIVALFELNKLDEAIDLSVALAQRTKEENDYLLTSDIYIKRQEYDLAVKYLESAYAKQNSVRVLDKMSIILYVNLSKKKEAIAHLETHSRILGCSKIVCERLIGFYSNDNNIEGLLSVFLRYYELTKDPQLVKKIIQIYTYKQDYTPLIEFLENSNADDKVLLQLYSSKKYYKKAIVLADKLYEESSDVNYLGQSAIFEYESAEDLNAKEMLQNVVAKLKKVVQKSHDTVYLNYLGYILIDHDIDVKKGMEYIDMVLVDVPNSAYYLDSKAWGHYKLGQCKKAKKLMDWVIKLEGGDNEEVVSHVKAINNCVEKYKKGKR